jgi:hypothetical protein
LEEEEFQTMVKREWKKYDVILGIPTYVQLVDSLKALKVEVVD